MIQVDEYEAIRRAHYVDGKSERQIARERGRSRKTVKKALENAAPKPYERTIKQNAPQLGNYRARIEALLVESGKMPRKQHYTGHKIYEVIHGEGYVGSESGVRRYIGQWRRDHNRPEVYLPLEYNAGADAQTDWGEGDVIFNGEQQTVQLFIMRLCYSRRLFMMAFPTQKLEAFLEGHVNAFAFFEGVPHRISYDNLKTAVKTILKGSQREEQSGFVAFRSQYLFESHFCTPGQGHEKGGVEHGVGYGRRNFLVPMPEVSSFEELNALLLSKCAAEDGRQVHGQPVTIGETWQQEKGQLRPLPAQRYACCTTRQVQLTPYSQVVFETNRYSVPAEKGRVTLTLRAYAFQIEVLHQAEVIARHERCYDHGQDVFNPLHYLSLLAKRPGAFEYAKPLREWRAEWPAVYEQVLAQLRETWPDGRGIREFIDILQLHKQHSPDLIAQALREALNYSCVHYEGVLLCLNQLLTPSNRPSALDLSAQGLSHLQQAGSQPLNLQQYDLLIGEN